MPRSSLVRFIKSRPFTSFGILMMAGIIMLGTAYTLYKNSKRKPPFDYINIKHKKVTGLSLAGGLINGLLAYTPPGYDTVPAGILYPVIIYFHGGSANGSGSEQDLNKVFDDSYYLEGYTIPGAIEQNTLVPEVVHEGKKYQYIVISPQVSAYDYPNNYPNGDDIDEVIDYVIANYKVDTTRIYLTGMSTGANMVIDYAASSPEHAKRVAAISMASLCSQFGDDDIQLGLRPGNIADSRLPTWFSNCREDTLRAMSCPPSVSASWIDPIVKAGGYPPRFTIFCKKVRIFEFWKDRDKPLQCAAIKHNTWSMMYRQGFDEDGGPDLYHWFIQFKR